MTPTVGSLFTGIGGFDLGFERAGFTVRWQVEIDAFCRDRLAQHWPHVERFSDVQICGTHNLAPVDVICGGFPCQDISPAGTRLGVVAGPRSRLWLEYLRIIRELRPTFAGVENSAALLHPGRGMGVVLGQLASIGYDAEWDCLPAAAFGADHLRDRVYIVAYPHGLGRWNQSIAESACVGASDVIADGTTGLSAYAVGERCGSWWSREELSRGPHAARNGDAPDATLIGRREATRQEQARQSHVDGDVAAAADAHADGSFGPGLPLPERQRTHRAVALGSGATDADAAAPRPSLVFGEQTRRALARWRSADGGGWGHPEPALVRSVHGLSYRVGQKRISAIERDRTKRIKEQHAKQVGALGNAVCPPVSEFLAWRIREAMTRLGLWV